MYKKLISSILLGSTVIIVGGSTNFFLLNSNKNSNIQSTYVKKVKSSNWYDQFKLQNPKDQFEVGYNNRYLKNNNPSFNQNDWININNQSSLDQSVYVYLPNVNSLNKAIKYITVNDSARLKQEYGYKNDKIFWNKINDNLYGSTSYITQDTTIAGISTLGTTKFKSILNSSNFKNASTQQIQQYNNFGIAKFSGLLINNWWNSNNWSKIIETKTSSTTIKANQLWNLKHWIDPNTQIGMNVPLSYIGQNSFEISKVLSQKNIYKVSISLHQYWIDNNNQLITLTTTPHWGISLYVNYQNESFASNQLVTNINQTLNSSTVLSYLKTSNYKNFASDINNYKNVADFK